MKVISLNAYCGAVFEALMAFVEDQKADTDIFCFQEILTSQDRERILTKSGKRANLLQELTSKLSGYRAFYAGTQDGFETSRHLDLGVQLGITIFVKRSLTVTDSGDFFIYKSFNSYVPPDFTTLPSNAQFVGLEVNGRPLTICNVHATSQPAHKLDTSERLIQSQIILDQMRSRAGEKIIVGDFNLLPQAESIRMFAQANYQNLISYHDIRSTRGSMNRLLHPEFGNGQYGYQEFADYAFVTPGVNVTGFEVPDVPISDHLPMILNFDLPYANS